MSNVLDIYNTLIRIETNNHVAKKVGIYSKRQISECYRLKAIELFRVIKRISETKPKSITYSICDHFYKDVECYLFTIKIYENKKYHLPSRLFQFHQPKYLFKGEINEKIFYYK